MPASSGHAIRKTLQCHMSIRLRRRRPPSRTISRRHPEPFAAMFNSNRRESVSLPRYALFSTTPHASRRVSSQQEARGLRQGRALRRKPRMASSLCHLIFPERLAQYPSLDTPSTPHGDPLASTCRKPAHTIPRSAEPCFPKAEVAARAQPFRYLVATIVSTDCGVSGQYGSTVALTRW